MDLHFLSSVFANDMDFMMAPDEGPKETAMPLEQQDYANEVASDTVNAPEVPITTEEEWNSLNAKESGVLMSEEEESFLNRSVAEASAGVSTEDIKKSAESMATLKLLQEANGSLPNAAAISAERTRIAKADVMNPENDQYPLELKRQNQLYNEKMAVLADVIQEVNLKADKASNGVLAKHVLGDLLVGVRGYKEGEALAALGFKNEDIDLVQASENQKTFRSAIGTMLMNPEINTANFVAAMKTMVDKWDEAGINPYVQKDMLNAVKDFDPGLESFFLAFDAAAVGQGLKTIAKGVSLFKGYPIKGLQTLGKGVAEATGVPFADKAFVKVSDAAIDKVVVPSWKFYDNLPFVKASREKNRAAAAELVEKMLDTPTEKRSMIKAARSTDGEFIYTSDGAMKPFATADKTAANEATTILKKIDNEIRERLQLAVDRVSYLQSFKKAAFEKMAQGLVDTLKADKLIGAGRGVGVTDIMSAFDNSRVLEIGADNNLEILVKLKNPAGKNNKYLSVLKDGKDAGLEAAQKRGSQLTKQFKELYPEAKESPYSIKTDVAYDNINKEWYTNLRIDTKKGWGTIHFELINDKEGLEKWRPFLSSIFTVSSDPSNIQRLNIARNLDSAVFRSTGEAAQRSFRALNNKDKALVQGIADISLRYNAWYDPEYLLSRGVSPKAIEAYQNYRAMNDLDHFVLSEANRASLQAKGGKKISFAGKEIEGVSRVIPTSSASDMLTKIKESGRDILLDAVDGVPMSAKELTDNPKRIEYFFTRGYKLIEGSIGPEEGIGARTFFYLLNPKDVSINELGEFTTKYVAGGRRFFDRRATFIKQVRMGTKVNGREGILGVNTFFADADEVGMARRAAVLEEIRSSIVKGDIEKADRLIRDANWTKAPFTDAKSFKEYFEAEGMDFKNLNNKLEAVKNGKTLVSYEELKKLKTVDDLVGFDEMTELSKHSHYQAISNEAKMKKRFRTGRELLTWDFDVAQPVDFEKQIQYLVNDMVFNGTMQDFTDFYAEYFAKLFRPIMREGGIERTAKELLFDGKVQEGLVGSKAELAKSAITAQKNYAAIRGVPTVVDTAIASNGKALFNWIGGLVENGLGISEDVSHGARAMWEKVLSTDALGYSRSFASHWYLGMFNISQLYKQAASDLAIVLLEPRASMKAAKWSLPFSSALRRSNGDVFKAMEKLATKFGDAPEAVKNNFKSLIDMGVFEHGTAGGFLEAGQTVKGKFNKISMYPFNVGEMQNRTMAYLTALYAKGYDGLKLTKEQLAEVAHYGQQLFLNMDATGLARAQIGTFGKTALQFMGYRLRWLETVMFSKELERSQKLRLALGTSLLVGSEGMLGVGASTWLTTNVYNIFAGHTEEPAHEDMNQVARFFQRGILNWFMEDMGLDIDVAAPFSLEFFDMLDSVYGVSQLDIASTQALGKGLDMVVKIGTVLKDRVFGEASNEDLENLLTVLAQGGKMPSSIRPYLGYLLWKTGAKYSTTGELTERSNSTLRAVLDGIGFNSLSMKDRQKAWTEWGIASKAEKQTEQDYYTAVLQAIKTNTEYDWKVADSILKLSDLPPLVKGRIFQRVMKKASDKLTVSAMERMLSMQLKEGGYYGNNIIQVMKRGE